MNSKSITEVWDNKDGIKTHLSGEHMEVTPTAKRSITIDENQQVAIPLE
ncbi:MAG: hypothetical protein IIC58_03745 [Proteobacteria bacterium]|nr:hypothetical protein [Pseudomonadota bacterium]